jgi:hypothetical protein
VEETLSRGPGEEVQAGATVIDAWLSRLGAGRVKRGKPRRTWQASTSARSEVSGLGHSQAGVGDCALPGRRSCTHGGGTGAVRGKGFGGGSERRECDRECDGHRRAATTHRLHHLGFPLETWKHRIGIVLFVRSLLFSPAFNGTLVATPV